MQEEEFTLTNPFPDLLRALIGAAGLFAIVTPAWEFRQAFLHPGWFSLFFGAITLGAWSVGFAFINGAIFGEDQHWRVRDGDIVIDRRNLRRRWNTILRGADIRDTGVEEQESDSGPDTFCVVLRTMAGETFSTRGFERRENAEKLEARLRARLGLT